MRQIGQAITNLKELKILNWSKIVDTQNKIKKSSQDGGHADFAHPTSELLRVGLL
jgi:hypothetical protein